MLPLYILRRSRASILRCTRLLEWTALPGGKKIIHIDLPSLIPITVIMLILSLGSIMGVGFEKIYLMQNPLNLSSSEVISTYVYKVGLVGANFSFSSAVGLFNSVINLILLLTVNFAAKKMSETSLW